MIRLSIYCNHSHRMSTSCHKTNNTSSRRHGHDELWLWRSSYRRLRWGRASSSSNYVQPAVSCCETMTDWPVADASPEWTIAQKSPGTALSTLDCDPIREEWSWRDKSFRSSRITRGKEFDSSRNVLQPYPPQDHVLS